MIGGTSGVSRFNIDKFSEVLGLRGMERVVGKRDDFVIITIFYLDLVHRFECRGDMFSFGFQLLREQGSFAVTRDEIFVFAVSLDKMSYNSLI